MSPLSRFDVRVNAPAVKLLWAWVGQKAHKVRNILDKVPDEMRAEIKAYLAAVREASNPDEGKKAAEVFIGRYARQFPSAVRSFTDDLPASLAHLRLPAAHRKFVRTTNLIERSFEEERRRTKTIPRIFDKHSSLKLAFGTDSRHRQMATPGHHRP